MISPYTDLDLWYINQGCESYEGNVEAVLRVLFSNPEKDLPVFLLRQVCFLYSVSDLS